MTIQTKKPNKLYVLFLRPTHSISFLCEFKKQVIISVLNTNSFKEVIPGTQYWSKLTPDKVPKGLPSQVSLLKQ